MTAGTNGEPDDPYGFLYRPAPGEEPAEAAGATGAYGPSTNRMMPQYVQVGQMNYGPPPVQTQTQPTIPAQADHGGTQPPRETGRPRRGGGSGSGRGPVIGAIVAIVIVAGVIAGVLMSNGGTKDEKADEPLPTAVTPSNNDAASEEPTTAATTASDGKFGATEAEDAILAGGATKVGTIANSTGTGMTDMSAPGSKITWRVEAPKEGLYFLALRAVNTASDQSEQNLAIVVNGQDTKNRVKIKSYSSTPSVSGTWNNVTLQEGSSEVSLVCAAGMTCKASLDQVWFSDRKPEFG